MAPLRAQAKASEAIVAATTMISAYSVVWDPVSAPNVCDEAVRLDNDTVLTGMATPFKGGHEGGSGFEGCGCGRCGSWLGGQGAEGTGHRRDDGEQPHCR
jgi:hypothetical protein